MIDTSKLPNQPKVICDEALRLSDKLRSRGMHYEADVIRRLVRSRVMSAALNSSLTKEIRRMQRD